MFQCRGKNKWAPANLKKHGKTITFCRQVVVVCMRLTASSMSCCLASFRAFTTSSLYLATSLARSYSWPDNENLQSATSRPRTHLKIFHQHDVNLVEQLQRPSRESPSWLYGRPIWNECWNLTKGRFKKTWTPCMVFSYAYQTLRLLRLSHLPSCKAPYSLQNISIIYCSKIETYYQLWTSFILLCSFSDSTVAFHNPKFSSS